MAFYPFFAHVNICHLLFHLLWPCLLHWHLPSAPFPLSSLSPSCPASSQCSRLFCPSPVSANMLQFLPNLKSNLALPISSPTHLLQSNIHLQPSTETAPININLFPAKLQAHAGCMEGLDLPAPSMWSLDILFSLRSCYSCFLLLFHLLVLLPPFQSPPWCPSQDSPDLPTHCLQDCYKALHMVSFPSPHLSGNLIHKHTICTDDSQIHLCLPTHLSFCPDWNLDLSFWLFPIDVLPADQI